MKKEKSICKTDDEFWKAIEPYWDYEKNEKHFSGYTRGSSKKIWVKCLEKDYHESYEITCAHFSGGRGCPWCSHTSGKINRLDSFAQYHVKNTDKDFLIKYWDWESNNKLNINPWEISPSNDKKVFIFCQEKEYHESYSVSCANFTNGDRCGYCGNNILHPLDSFAKVCIDTFSKDFLIEDWDYELNLENPWEISPYSKKKVFIKCKEKDYHGSYQVTCSNFLKGNRCPYCNVFASGKVHPLDSIGKLYPQILEIWSDKNTKSPFKCAPKSNKKVWWTCPNGKHEDYLRSPGSSNSHEFRCPQCSYSKGETKIEEYFTKFDFRYVSQKEFEGLIGLGNGLLSYDFYLEKYNLLIEYQGEQHKEYRRGFHKTRNDFEKQQEHDRRKKQYCVANGIRLLEIWYYDFDNIEQILDKQLDNNITA